jgi:uncharacterized protein
VIVIDSNIWCYYLDRSAKEHRTVADFLEKIFVKKEIYVTTVILMEVAHFLFRNLGAVDGKEKMDVLLSLPLSVLDFDYATLTESSAILAQNLHRGIGGRDATILAAMKKLKAKAIMTHDKAFQRVEGISVIDPVSPGGSRAP